MLHKTVLLILTLLLVFTTSAHAEQAEHSKLLFWRIEAKEGVSKESCDSLSGLVEMEIAHFSEQKVISEADIRSALKTEEIQKLCGKTGNECAIELSSALGAKETITGDLGKVGKIWILNLRRIDVRAVEVVEKHSVQFEGSLDNLFSLLPDAVASLFNKTLTPEQKNARLLAQRGKKPKRKISTQARFEKTEQALIRVVVTPLKAKGLPEATAQTLTSSLSTFLGGLQAFSIVSKEEVRVMLTHEEDLRKTGCDEPDCFVKVGEMLKAKKVVAGSVGLIEDTRFIHLQLIDVQKAAIDERVEMKATKEGEAALLNALAMAADKLFQPLLKERRGTIVIHCNTEGASVYIDDKLSGSTPILPQVVAAGWHSVRIEKEGHIVQGKDVLVKIDKIQTMRFSLAPSVAFFKKWKKRQKTYRALAWSSAALAVASLTSAIGLNVWNDDRYDNEYIPRKRRWISDPYGQGVNERESINSLGKSIERTSYAFISLYALATVSTGLTLYFFLDSENPTKYDAFIKAEGQNEKPSKPTTNFSMGIDPKTSGVFFSGEVRF